MKAFASQARNASAPAGVAEGGLTQFGAGGEVSLDPPPEATVEPCTVVSACTEVTVFPVTTSRQR
jgi:hypothetical protein